MNRKGFIFDLDGVIVDTAGFHYLAWRNLANKLGFEFTEEQNERFKGVSRKRSLDLLLEIGQREATADERKVWLVDKNKEYLSYIDNMTEADILPGVKEILDYLIEKGQPIALGSASKNARPILEKVGLASVFNTIVDGNDVKKAKPDPEVFLIAAQQLDVAPKDAIVFEDSIAGIKAANIGGMTSVGIGDAKVLKGAHYNFKDFTEMNTQFIDKLLKA